MARLRAAVFMPVFFQQCISLSLLNNVPLVSRHHVNAVSVGACVCSSFTVWVWVLPSGSRSQTMSSIDDTVNGGHPPHMPLPGRSLNRSQVGQAATRTCSRTDGRHSHKTRHNSQMSQCLSSTVTGIHTGSELYWCVLEKDEWAAVSRMKI